MNHFLIQVARVWRHPRQLLVSVLRRRSRNFFHPIIILTGLVVIALGPVPSFVRAPGLGGQLLAVLWAALVVPLIYGFVWVLAAMLKVIGRRLDGTGDDYDLRYAVGYALLPPLTLGPAAIALVYGAMLWPALGPAAALVPWVLTAVFCVFLLIELSEAHDVPLWLAAISLLIVAAIVLVVAAAVFGLFSRFLPLLSGPA